MLRSDSCIFFYNSKEARAITIQRVIFKGSPEFLCKKVYRYKLEANRLRATTFTISNLKEHEILHRESNINKDYDLIREEEGKKSKQIY